MRISYTPKAFCCTPSDSNFVVYYCIKVIVSYVCVEYGTLWYEEEGKKPISLDLNSDSQTTAIADAECLPPTMWPQTSKEPGTVGIAVLDRRNKASELNVSMQLHETNQHEFTTPHGR